MKTKIETMVYSLYDRMVTGGANPACAAENIFDRHIVRIFGK